MHRRHRQDTFERGSNVREYWLANCVGFAVAGSPGRARVEAVVVGPPDGRARHVVVRGATGLRTRVLPVERIEAVDPFERVLYTETSRPIRTAARSLALTLARSAGRFQLWLRPRLRTTARATWASSRAGVAWLRPRLRALALATWARCRAGVAWLRPRLRTAAVAAWERCREAAAWLRPRTARAARSAARAVRAASGVVIARLQGAAHDAAEPSNVGRKDGPFGP